jgi:pimeloyl-ACP methyl ester carboxylesterase
MQQAVVTVIDALRAGGASQVDLLALSLGCEFAAEAVLQRPGAVRTLALVSPTGMERRRTAERLDGGTREVAWLHALLRRTPVGGWLYRLLTRPGSVRWFLARTWGRGEADARLLAHALRCAAQPGARFAPLDFVAGALFTRGVIERYRALPVPLWVAHGNRGSFTDFGACPLRTGSDAGPSQSVERTVFDTGAMPHCERPDSFQAAYQRFLQQHALRAALSPRPGTAAVAQAARAAREAATLQAGADAAPPRPRTTGAPHGLAEDPGRPGGWPDRRDQPEPGGRGAGSTAPQGH